MQSSLQFDQEGSRRVQPVSTGKVDFVAPDGVYTSVPGFELFFGTSAAAPDAAAMAALVLQTDPQLSPAWLSALIQADKAVELAGGVPGWWGSSSGEVPPLFLCS